jgi:DNA polymerase-3 subunit delta
MQIKPEQLSKVLTKQLDSLYFVFGPELLLVEQSLTHIKNTAKAQGFDERVSFEVNGNFDWGKITAELSATSLFSSKRIIECHLTTGKIGQKGSKALSEIAANVADDILFIVSTGKLDFAQQKSKWFKTLEANGNIVQAWEVQRDHLVGWIANHMAELGLESNPKIAENIAYYTEGNLLASMQEIQKLKMAYPNGNIDIEDYLQQLSQQSQYTISLLCLVCQCLPVTLDCPFLCLVCQCLPVTLDCPLLCLVCQCLPVTLDCPFLCLVCQ